MDPVNPPPATSQPVDTASANAPTSPANILAKLSLADKIIGGAAVVSLISTFLPALSISIDFLGVKTSNSYNVVADWRGKLGFLCIVAAGVVLFLLLKNGAGTPAKKLVYALLGLCAAVPLLALLLLISISSASTGLPAGSENFAKISIGFGAYVYLLGGLGMAAGGFLKAKDLKMIPGTPAPAGTGA